MLDAIPRTWERMGAGWTNLVTDTPSTDIDGIPAKRDARLDMFRGLALVMIFINHVPGTVYENFTSRNFGFSDAAEAFVFMSGLAAGLAYSPRFRNGSFWLATARVWARSRHLYYVHLTITLLSIAIFAAAALWFGQHDVLTKNNLPRLFSEPLATWIGIPLLTHQLGYLNILPLYITLLLATPLFLWVGLRRPLLLLGASVALWALAGQFRWNLPNYPTQGGWFFNPLSWQLLFVTGLLCGAAMKEGKRFFPRTKLLFGLTLAWVVIALFWVKLPVIGSAGMAMLSAMSKAGLPFYLTWFDKTFLALPRLSHALALFYVVASITAIRQFASANWAAPLRLLGRQGLPVFAFGTVLSMALQAIKTPLENDPLIDGLLLAGGLGLQLGLAWILTRTAEMSRARAAAAIA
ncbi:MAG: OpgC [Devosia sp.]|uniref:OpgC family protein n=1 Tax=Devosia sp. TaxID=1871048 RepID=UPI002610E982|nr:OpgC domain-containing protein [Devosia sp.]MDB5536927.1 OpgC [Devosia sp.]MDB5587801.1 OpgC [Devosia sp.]